MTDLLPAHDNDVDILIVGGGVAGASAAIAARDAGLRVALIEKGSAAGGNCIYSAGNLLQLAADTAEEHLASLAFNRTGSDVIAGYAEGLGALRPWLESLGAITADVPSQMLPTCWPHSPGADGVVYYSVVGDEWGGGPLWDVLGKALTERGVVIRTETRFEQLVVEEGRVVGATVTLPDASSAVIRAALGVVLTTGGFENSAELTETYLPISPVFVVGNPANTGDALRAVQSVGAALWHMSNFYGFWCFRRQGFDSAFALLFFSPSHVIVDSDGRRFHDETSREPHDVMRSVGDFLPDRENRPSMPAYLVCDRALLESGPLARFRHPSGYRWSADNSVELEAGWITQAGSAAGLAESCGFDTAVFEATLASYNSAAGAAGAAGAGGSGGSGTRDEFGRAAERMHPLDTSELFAVQLWPGVATTSGGPRRDADGRVLRSDGSAIEGLYAAGGNGGVWGYLTEHGGGLTDGLVFGQRAAKHAAGRIAVR